MANTKGLAMVLLTAVAALAAVPEMSLAVTGEQFVDEVAVRLGQSTSDFINLVVLTGMVAFLFLLYMAVKISESRQHRDVEKYYSRFKEYREQVSAVRAARRQKSKTGARRRPGKSR